MLCLLEAARGAVEVEGWMERGWVSNERQWVGDRVVPRHSSGGTDGGASRVSERDVWRGTRWGEREREKEKRVWRKMR